MGTTRLIVAEELMFTSIKDIWDNVRCNLEGSELTKEDRESQLNQAIVQEAGLLFQKGQVNQNRDMVNNARVLCQPVMGEAHNRVRNANPGQAMHVKCYNTTLQENGSSLVLKIIIVSRSRWTGQCLLYEDEDEQPVQDLAHNVDNVFQAMIVCIIGILN
ncbi:hypothetical protein Tco_0391142 [Tanacetum coccineum]